MINTQQAINSLGAMRILLQYIDGKNFIVISENLSYETGWNVGSSEAMKLLSKTKEKMQSRAQTIKKFFGLSR